MAELLGAVDLYWILRVVAIKLLSIEHHSYLCPYGGLSHAFGDYLVEDTCVLERDRRDRCNPERHELGHAESSRSFF